MKLQHIFNGIRANQWWHFKVNIFVTYILLAGLGITSHPTNQQAFLWFCFLLALLPGATYVSLINDYSDYHHDRLANKISGIDLIGKQRSLIFIVVSLAFGLLFGALLPISIKARFFYAAAYIAFSMYSLPPIRLKNRGILGIVADASGAHLFPILFLFAAIQQHYFDAITATLIGINVVCFGLRGILWHQFADKQNDLQAGVKTLVTSYNNSRLKQLAFLLLILEIAAFLTYIIYQQHYFILLSLLAYALYLFIIHRFLRIELVVAVVQYSNGWTFLMGAYYQLFLPLALLIYFSLSNPLTLLGVPLFMWLFSDITRQHVQHIKQLIDRLR